MKAYSYNNYGLYQGEVERQYNSIDKIWLMPASATEKIPPLEPGMVAVWNGNEWELKVDNCGIYYDTSTGIEKKINNPLDDISNLTKLKPEYQFSKWDGSKWIEDVAKKTEYENNIIKANLEIIDKKRIRSVCEYFDPDVTGQEKQDALLMLKSLNTQAKVERAKLK